MELAHETPVHKDVSPSGPWSFAAACESNSPSLRRLGKAAHLSRVFDWDSQG